MANVFKCGRCGAVTEDGAHLCAPEPVADKTGYCGRDVEGGGHVCEPERQKAGYACETCGRPAEQPDLLCKPARVAI